jgi:hypothetical protein
LQRFRNQNRTGESIDETVRPNEQDDENARARRKNLIEMIGGMKAECQGVNKIGKSQILKFM